MNELDPRVEELVQEANSRAVERVMLEFPEPTATDAILVVVQAQISVLARGILDDDEFLEFWRDVVTVIKNGKTNGTA